MRETVDLVISASYMLTPQMSILENQAVAIRGTRIVAVGSAVEIDQRYEAKQRLSGEGKLLMPGLVDAHTHNAQNFLRGRTAEQLPMVWTRILVPFESNLDEDDVYASAMLAGVEYIKSGVTSFAESGGPHMHRVAEAVEQLGLRAVIARSTMDCGDVPDSMKESTYDCIDRTEALYKEWNGRGDGRIQIWFALRQVMTSTPELVEAVEERSRQYGTGVHIHLAEHRAEVMHTLQRYGLRPGFWLESKGLMDDRVLCAHSVLLREDEMIMMVRNGAHPVHCPRANLVNHGFAKTPLFFSLGCHPGIASDGGSGNSLDLFQAMRLQQFGVGSFWGLNYHDATAVRSTDVLTMATMGGARAMRQADQIGSIVAGKRADVILVNLAQPHLSPFGDLVHAVTANASGQDVTDVVANGRILMKDRQVLVVDEAEVLARAKERKSRIYNRLGW